MVTGSSEAAQFDIHIPPLTLAPIDLDCLEDFVLSSKDKNYRFGGPLTEHTIRNPIERRAPEKAKQCMKWPYGVWCRA